MHKVKTVSIQQEDGTYLQQIPISADAQNVDMQDGSNLEDKIAVLQSQINTLQTLTPGSTTGDAQLIDIRLKTDGTRGATAGAAVRQQFNALKSYTDNQIEDLTEHVDNAISEVYDRIDSEVEDFNNKCQQILDVAQSADEIAVQALGTANNAENYMASLDNQIKELQSALENVSIDVDDLGLEQDPDTYYVYPTYKGVRSENGIPLASSGGGGGGGTGPDVISAVLTVENTSGWLSKTIPSGSSCSISFTWSSVEDGMSTGDGSIRITVNEIVRATMQIKQGNISVDLAPYLTTGTNKVKVRISDTYDQGKTVTFNITSIALSISSTFDSSKIYNSAIMFPYTPVGAVQKTIYFQLDGEQLGTQVTAVSGRQMSYMIPAQNHGPHNIRVYFTATINNEEVRSNELYYEFICVEPLNENIIVASSFDSADFPQYSLVTIPFQVYDPKNLTAEAVISVNNQVVSTQTVDRSQQNYVYRANNAGAVTVKIQSGTVSKTVSFNVTESDIHVQAETEALALYLTSTGRSNNEEHPESWSYNNIEATLSNFNFTSDGWQTDEDGVTCLKVSNAARVTIPYKPFAEDFRSTGKTIELEFAARNVLDYDAVILSCMNGGRGISLTSQKATLISEQSEISTQYKEDEHVRISFVVEKRSEDRLLLVYINGIPSGVVQYPIDDDFSQVTPANITIGSNDCTINIYNIRIYDNNLNGNQILDNWIADTTDGTLMLDRYTRNTVYDAYGKIVPANLPASLPYFILNAPELPQYKGDKKTISGSYVDKMYPSKSFTFTGCQINVQGTSSAVYARKNYDMQFKEGFEMNSGSHADTYLLRAGNIPFNRFVLKADVASSEGANNVELVRLYNDACPYKTPEMKADSRVRWGIDGFPIVVFWNNTDTQETTFLGKYNFNFPKRAPGPYGYADDDTLESWQFQNNTSNLMLFKTDYFDESMYTDPDTGDTKELWRYDYEARFPSDEYTDYTLLQELESFVYSTYRENATNEALSESVTYDGIEYTTDNAAYRLAKFRAEFPTYAELDTFLFYYIFTELFLMVDSRAKNLFIGFNGSAVTAPGRHAVRKATAQPYDMDTAIGTNNEGTLVFGYSLEDTDHLTGNVNIFNGQESVLWCNLRDAFETEIRQMYQSLRSAGIISYNNIENRFEQHQSKWPEAIWIEDARFKYIDPLTNPDAGKEPTADYLSMMQGSKAEQRKWWLFNRFKYMDSKWNAGDALAQVIILRGYEKANITVTPYTDIYPTIKYASYVVQARGTHGQPTELVCPLDTVSDTEISIYSAPQLASVGDLSPLKVGFANFSPAINLQEIKIGDADSNYSNTNLYSLTLGNNVLLKKLDVRNCSGLGDTTMTGHTQTAVDLSNCSIIEEIYFDGTKVQGVTLPNGGNIKKLHLPDTITNLTILNQKNISELVVAGYSNVSTLRIENSSVDTKTMLKAIPENSRVRLINVAWEAEDAAQIEDLLDTLDTMRGLDEGGNNMATAQISGTIHTNSLKGSQIASYQSRYPYIKILADHTESYISYYNGDSLYYTEKVLDGGNGVYTGTPTKASDVQYTYTFAGWSKENDNTVDSDARTAIIADRNVYACYTGTLQKYTVTFIKASEDGGGTLQTIQNVNYGTSVTAANAYTGSTPTTTQGDASEYPFIGWSPATAIVHGNTVFTATFDSPTKEITDTWEQIGQAIDNGTYKTKYKVGWYKPLDLGTKGIVNMQIVAMDADTLTAGGTVPLTFVGMEILETKSQMNSSNTNANGWAATNVMKPYLANTIMPLIDPLIRMRIQAVDKTYYDYTTTSTLISSDKLWIPSAREIFGEADGYEDSGVMYTNIYSNATKRKKHSTTLTSYSYYWLRSARSDSSTGFCNVSNKGIISKDSADGIYGVCIGFCLGVATLNVTEITDTWDQIINAIDTNTYKKYDIGQYKPLDLGTEGTINMQIVAMDADELASGGTAPLTFIGMELLNTEHRMNPNNSSDAIGTGGNGGWENCEMRSYLTSTILPLITTASAIVASRLQRVKKIQSTVTDSTRIQDGQTTTETIWIPSNREIYGSTIYESTGAIYTSIFKDTTSRIKKLNGSAYHWWLRSAYDVYNFHLVNGNGRGDNYNASSSGGVALGFCLGLEPETITDDWATILANTNPSATYNIGDTKSIIINNEPHLMQIVGFDTDDMTSGGKAKISWLMKDQLNVTHKMNAAYTNENGWPATEMRTWLRDTILPTIDSNIKSHIVDVDKTYYDYTDKTTEISSDNIWLASVREIFDDTSYESSGPDYTALFIDATSRIKKRSSTAVYYWLRSANSGSAYDFCCVNSSGSIGTYYSNNAFGVCVGFCTN